MMRKAHQAMNSVDSKALKILMKNGRATWAELGQAVGLSAPAAADRIRKLEERGVIRGFSAIVSPDASGYPLLAFVLITLTNQRRRSQFIGAIQKMPEVAECHHITGDDDYLLKVRCRSTSDLDRILATELKEKLGVARTRTTIVLSTAKESVVVPIAP